MEMANRGLMHAQQGSQGNTVQVFLSCQAVDVPVVVCNLLQRTTQKTAWLSFGDNCPHLLVDAPLHPARGAAEKQQDTEQARNLTKIVFVQYKLFVFTFC